MKNQPEFQLQCQIAEYLRTAHKNVRFLSDVRASLRLTIPQQVRSKKIQADGFACPDLIIFQPSGNYHGFFAELKAESPYKKDGTLKKDKHLESQREAITRLIALRYWADFYWNLDQFMRDFKAYINRGEYD